MFTGIVQEMGKVKTREQSRLQIAARITIENAKVGDSISVNGACLTITKVGGGSFSVDVTPETLRRTNLGSLEPGDLVNLEKALSLGQLLGGHLVQGHVDGTGTIQNVEAEGNSKLVTIEAPPEIMKYVVEKGFISIDGVSFTIVSRNVKSFVISVIPYTSENTIVGSEGPGDQVNLEADIIAKYAEQFINPYRPEKSRSRTKS